jgi:alpha-glucosidase
MFFHYPNDPNVNALGYQYFYGPGILVAPVTEENSTTASFYLPNNTFYDYYTHEVVQGTGSTVTRENVDYTTIPLFYKAGNVIVQRTNSANTTTELRKQPFTLIIAPDAQGKAEGTLYLDDGESIEQPAYSLIKFSYDNRRLVTSGHFGYDPGVGIVEIVVLGSGVATGGNGSDGPASYARSAKPEGGMSLMGAWSASV